MSDLIRMYGMKVSHRGLCRKCHTSRDTGDHTKCDRWPTINSSQHGFHFVGNAQETNLAELKRVVEAICKGDPDETPVQFDLRIRHRVKEKHPAKEKGIVHARQKS